MQRQNPQPQPAATLPSTEAKANAQLIAYHLLQQHFKQQLANEQRVKAQEAAAAAAIQTDANERSHAALTANIATKAAKIKKLGTDNAALAAENERLRAALKAEQDKAIAIEIVNMARLNNSYLKQVNADAESKELRSKLQCAAAEIEQLKQDKSKLQKRIATLEPTAHRSSAAEKSRNHQLAANRKLRAERDTQKIEINKLRRKAGVNDDLPATTNTAAGVASVPASSAAVAAAAAADQLEDGELPPTPTSSADAKQQPGRKKAKVDLTVNIAAANANGAAAGAGTDAASAASLTSTVSPAVFSPLNIRSKSGKLTIRGVTSLTPTDPAALKL